MLIRAGFPGERILLSASNENDIQLLANQEYVFVNCWLLDEVYFDFVSADTPDDAKYDLSLRNAEDILGSAWNSVCSVQDGQVFLYHGYFSSNEQAMAKTLSADAVLPCRVIPKERLANGEYLAMEQSDFETELQKLYEAAEPQTAAANSPENT